jgi:hypothetical protein
MPSPYQSAEEKLLIRLEEKLDRIIAIVDRKTAADYTRIAREETESAANNPLGLGIPVNQNPLGRHWIHGTEPANTDPVLVDPIPSSFTVERAKSYLESLPDAPKVDAGGSPLQFITKLPTTSILVEPNSIPEIVPAVVDNAERIDDGVPSEDLPF